MMKCILGYLLSMAVIMPQMALAKSTSDEFSYMDVLETPSSLSDQSKEIYLSKLLDLPALIERNNGHIPKEFFAARNNYFEKQLLSAILHLPQTASASKGVIFIINNATPEEASRQYSFDESIRDETDEAHYYVENGKRVYVPHICDYKVEISWHAQYLMLRVNDVYSSLTPNAAGPMAGCISGSHFFFNLDQQQRLRLIYGTSFP